MTRDKAQESPTAYSPAAVEERLYRSWLERGYFTPRIDPARQPFVIIMPPPNVTGELHLGHALTATLEDVMTRWHRMRGEPTLWLPGVDHAGIATQVVVERELAKEGLTRHQLGREKFVERVWQWVNRYRNRIAEQHRRLGASCDWTRERFTLDPGPSKAVRTTFVNLYRKGLIYRGERIINWCVRCATALSDLEVEHREVQGNLYHVRYPLADGPGHLTVATTRPETMLGDTAVAVNPEDPRHKDIVGRLVVLPILERRIPVIADGAVDTAFGTGALKITPGHDPTDFEIGERHGLPIVNAINLDGTMSADAGPYQGTERLQCRKAIVADLERQGLLERVEPYRHAVGHCQRCREVVEPLVSRQWFVKVEPLARPAIEAVEKGVIRIVPERFTKVYLNWMYNIRDWCISRQLWWGHRIPVWHCSACGGPTVDYQDPDRCTHCGSPQIEQDPDVLDTWFSSGLWPHSTLGWPDDTEDLRCFYPSTVMETGYDILFFWVARMVMLGLENMKDKRGEALAERVPFRVIYLHGLVRDVEGQKMSKTRGNVIDPLQAVERYGCDALRFALTVGNAPGNDLRLGAARMEAGRNFANKLWNASNFVLRNLKEGAALRGWKRPRPSHLEDRWILSRLNRLVDRVTRHMEEYQFGEAEQAIYSLLWDEYCDWYIELAKVRLRSGQRPSPLPILTHVLEASLRLLHPFMPFVTEEIWQRLVPRLAGSKGLPESIVIAPYPEANLTLLDDEAEARFGVVAGVVRAVRNARAEFRLPPQRSIEAIVDPADLYATLESEAEAIRVLARVQPLRLLAPDEPRPPSDRCLRAVVEKVAILIPTEGVVDVPKERQRLTEELAECETGIGRLESRLKDQQFLSKAPEEVVERERERLQRFSERRGKVQELLSQLPA